jgi:MFS superfamily sulfate permease-like transporter
VQALLGMCDAGTLVEFISPNVIGGFTSAAAITIGAGQLHNLLGMKIPMSRFVWKNIYHLFTTDSNAEYQDIVLGCVCIGAYLRVSFLVCVPVMRLSRVRTLAHTNRTSDRSSLQRTRPTNLTLHCHATMSAFTAILLLLKALPSLAVRCGVRSPACLKALRLLAVGRNAVLIGAYHFFLMPRVLCLLLCFRDVVQ